MLNTQEIIKVVSCKYLNGILQVGLAVGDTEKVKKLATIKRLSLQIEYHIEIEGSYPVFITRPFYEEVYDDKPNKHSMHQR